MKKTLLIIYIVLFSIQAKAQCHFIPSTSTSIDTLSYSFSGGLFASYGCAPIDPTYWLSGNGNSVTITFVNPESNPSFRVWGMNDDDYASVSVNGISYPLTSLSAAYDSKVVCGISPGPDGVTFIGGNLAGANSNSLGNYSYQNVQLVTTNVSSITITGISGAGWGFAGVSVNCPLFTGVGDVNNNNSKYLIYPNPFTHAAFISLPSVLTNADLNIYNIQGLKVKSINNINGNIIKIDKDNLLKGIYFIKLTEESNTIIYEKLVLID